MDSTLIPIVGIETEVFAYAMNILKSSVSVKTSNCFSYYGLIKIISGQLSIVTTDFHNSFHRDIVLKVSIPIRSYILYRGEEDNGNIELAVNLYRVCKCLPEPKTLSNFGDEIILYSNLSESDPKFRIECGTWGIDIDATKLENIYEYGGANLKAIENNIDFRYSYSIPSNIEWGLLDSILGIGCSEDMTRIDFTGIRIKGRQMVSTNSHYLGRFDWNIGGDVPGNLAECHIPRIALKYLSKGIGGIILYDDVSYPLGCSTRLKCFSITKHDVMLSLFMHAYPSPITKDHSFCYPNFEPLFPSENRISISFRVNISVLCTIMELFKGMKKSEAGKHYILFGYDKNRGEVYLKAVSDHKTVTKQYLTDPKQNPILKNQELLKSIEQYNISKKWEDKDGIVAIDALILKKIVAGIKALNPIADVTISTTDADGVTQLDAYPGLSYIAMGISI